MVQEKKGFKTKNRVVVGNMEHMNLGRNGVLIMIFLTLKRYLKAKKSHFFKFPMEVREVEFNPVGPLHPCSTTAIF